MKYGYLLTGFMLPLVLAACSTTGTSNNSSVKTEEKTSRSVAIGKFVAFQNFCYKKGYYDSDFVAKNNFAINSFIDNNPRLYNKDLFQSISNQGVAYLTNLSLNSSEAEIQKSCYESKPRVTEVGMMYEAKLKEIEAQRNRPVIINNTPSYTPPMPRTTNCMNLGFGMTSCSTF